MHAAWLQHQVVEKDRRHRYYEAPRHQLGAAQVKDEQPPVVRLPPVTARGRAARLPTRTSNRRTAANCLPSWTNAVRQAIFTHDGWRRVPINPDFEKGQIMQQQDYKCHGCQNMKPQSYVRECKVCHRILCEGCRQSANYCKDSPKGKAGCNGQLERK